MVSSIFKNTLAVYP